MDCFPQNYQVIHTGETGSYLQGGQGVKGTDGYLVTILLTFTYEVDG